MQLSSNMMHATPWPSADLVAPSKLPLDAPTRPDPTPEQPTLQGTFVDTIDDVSDDLVNTTDVLPLIKLLTLAYKVRCPDPCQEDRLNTLMRTLSADRLGKVRTDAFPCGFTRDEVTYAFCRFLSPILNGLTGLVEFERAVGADVDPASFRHFWTLDDRNLLADAVSGTSPAAGAAAPPFLDTFVEAKSLHRIALTRDRGMLALVPSSVRAGDEVWSVAELSAPIILRKAPADGEPALVEGYIHGFCETDTERNAKHRYHDLDLPLSSVAVGLAGSIPY
ncbi:hypothetical protein ACHAQA_009515 [Verticillium albo-atrum]